MHLSLLDRHMTGPPCGDGAAVTTDHGITFKPLAYYPGDNLGLHGDVLAGRLLFQQRPPIFHAGLCFLQKAPVFVALQEWDQCLESA